MVTFGVMMMTGPRGWIPTAVAAEAAGLESVWVPDHLIMPVTMTGEPNSPHEGEPPISASTHAYDSWVQIAAMAASTSTLRFGTNVYNIGLRHPFVTARAVATADAVSDGRIELGIGASWLRQEWEATGLEFDGRGRRIDETVRIVRRLFTEEIVEHHGECFSFPPVGFWPKPRQQPWPPMHIGGDSGVAMRRAALLGDGWIPMHQTLDSLPPNLDRIRSLRADAGIQSPFHVTVTTEVDTIDDVKRWEDAGATRLLVLANTSPRDAVEVFGRFGDEIISKL
jgi:probable F420-dependent oxidoreductase